jgi:ribonuclease HI
MNKKPIINIQNSHHRRNTEVIDNGGQRGVVLSTIMAASGNNHTKNPKTKKIKQHMDKRKGNVTLCWVPGHARITANEKADEEAKRALEESIPNAKSTPQRA